MKPSILLLDEPLASLDPASARESLDLVRRLADEGMTVLMVEHRVEDVLRIRPERVMFLSQGEVRYFGDREGLFKAVDYREVKLPARDIVALAAADPPPAPLRILPGRAGFICIANSLGEIRTCQLRIRVRRRGSAGNRSGNSSR